MSNLTLQPPSDQQIEAALLAVVAARGQVGSACPSEVARKLAPNAWRDLMPNVRRIATELAQRGSLEITQAGLVVLPIEPFKGPIRVRLSRNPR